MTRKEARIRLITKREELMHKYKFEEAEVLTMAIEALSEETPTNTPTNTPTKARKNERGMTREEAIEILRCVPSSEIGDYSLDEISEALTMAIEALQKPPISQRRMYQAGYRQGREETLKQVTGKLNNSDDSLLTADSEVCKEQKSKLDRKTEPMKTTDYCDICKRDMYEFCVADNANPYCVPSHYEIKQDEPQKSDLISRAEAIRKVTSYIWHLPNDVYPQFNGYNVVENIVMDALSAPPSADRPKGEWTLLTEERPVDNYEIIATVYWPGYGDSTIAVGHIDRFDNWHLYSPTEGELIKGFEVIAWMPLPELYKESDNK